MPGRKSRSKGARRELEFAALVHGQRVPLSGAAGGEFADDVLLPNGLRAQVKARATGWKGIYDALGEADILALKADRKPWLVVLTGERFVELMQAKEAPL